MSMGDEAQVVMISRPPLGIAAGAPGSGKTRPRAAVVHCHVSRENIRRRNVERFHRGERHPAHFDGALPSAKANQR